MFGVRSSDFYCGIHTNLIKCKYFANKESLVESHDNAFYTQPVAMDFIDYHGFSNLKFS